MDVIRGGLVNLLYQGYKVFRAGENCQGFEIDVMDFLKVEIHWAMCEKKNHVYAPFIMKLILSKMENINVKNVTTHIKGTLQVKGEHVKPQGRRAYASSDDEMEVEEEAQSLLGDPRMPSPLLLLVEGLL